MQPQSLDLGVYEELEDEPGVDEGAPGAEVLDSNDDMDEDNEIPFEIPRIRGRITPLKHWRIKLRERESTDSSSRKLLRMRGRASSSGVLEVEKENTVTDAFFGCKTSQLDCSWLD